MKNSKTLFLFFCLAAIIYSCTGSDSERSPQCGFGEQYTLEPGTQYAGQGQIVGFEGTACMCCGGYWLVTTEADSVLFGYVPENIDFSFQPDEQFPIPVEYEFFTDSAICWQVTHYVTLLSLKRI
jgi:hypothetical protein